MKVTYQPPDTGEVIANNYVVVSLKIDFFNSVLWAARKGDNNQKKLCWQIIYIYLICMYK